jgi:hypothetical protein
MGIFLLLKMILFFSAFHIRFFRSNIGSMGDSDDDFDSRRNRDKFRRERDDFGGNRPNHNRGGGGGDWNDGR